MIDFIRQLEKAELHLHVEGSVEPQTVLEIVPGIRLEEVKRKYHHSDFAGFIESYKWINRLLSGPGEYRLITQRLLERLASEGVRYAELNLSVGVMLWKQQDVRAIFESVQAAAADSEVEVRWIFDAIRQFGPGPARRVADLAVEWRSEGVVAFGIGGDEVAGPAEWFEDVFAFTKKCGLRLVPHAGETVGPESVWAAIRLGADRIGHGIRAAEDPDLMRYLRDNNIPLEVCISSNVCTGAVPSLQEHPVRRLYDAGVPLTLSTDDPALFETTLTREYQLAAERFGFSKRELGEIASNSFRYAFGYRQSNT